MTTTQLVESAVFRHVVLTNQSTYLPYCSGLISRDVIVRCRATGDPIPTIDIYRENDDGSQHRFDEVYRGDGEVAIGHFPIKSGENIMFHCNASNIVSYLTISVNLTYTCKCFYYYSHNLCNGVYIHIILYTSTQQYTGLYRWSVF